MVRNAAFAFPGNQLMLEVVALGGLGEFGMNMLAFTYGETTIVVDAGVMFPDPELLGVDRIIPDLTYLQQKGRVSALVLSGKMIVTAPRLTVSRTLIGVGESKRNQYAPNVPAAHSTQNSAKLPMSTSQAIFCGLCSSASPFC